MLFSAFLVPVNAFSLISLVRAQHVLCFYFIVNNLSDQDCPSIEGGPPASDCAYLGLVTFTYPAFVTETLTLAPTTLMYEPDLDVLKCTHIPKTKFLGQGFQKSQHEQNRQAHKHTDTMSYHAHSWMLTIIIMTITLRWLMHSNWAYNLCSQLVNE